MDTQGVKDEFQWDVFFIWFVVVPVAITIELLLLGFFINWLCTYFTQYSLLQWFEFTYKWIM